MPRAAILAAGAVAAAWLIPQAGLPASMLAGAAWLIACAVARSADRASVARILLIGLVGFAAVWVRIAPGVLGASEAPAAALPDGRGPWVFAVEAVGSPRDGQQRATLGPPPVPLGFDHASGASIRVAATMPAYPAVIPGDIVVVAGSIRPPPDSPYGRYLVRIGADGTLQARTLAIAASPGGSGQALETVRRAAGDALATVLPEPEAGLAAGILIGLRDLVDRDLAAAFTTAGVSHVVAISGWNIAIVAAAVGAFAGRLGRRRRSVVTVLAIVAYVVFAGASASVVRAGLMAGVVLLARESGRAGQAATALGWTVTLLLLADPGLVLDAGLQLSALATAGLIMWATPLTGALDRLGRGHLPAWLTENLGVSLAAQAATLPLILASFGRLSIIAPVVNLVVVPLVAPAMAAGSLALLAGSLVAAGLPWAIGATLAAPAWVLLRVTVAIVEAGASVPFASVALQAPLDVVTAVIAALLIVGIHRRYRDGGPTGRPTPTVPAPQTAAPAGTRQRTPRIAAGRWSRPAAMVLAVAVLIAGTVVAARPDGVARVTVLDVGQGDAILVEGSNGGRLLIDGGPDPNRLLVALDARLPPWDRRIDVVVLSHPHEDHVAGLARLLDRYRVRRVFEPGTRGPGSGYAAWLARLAGRDAPERHGLAAGDRLTIDEIRLTVLWPIRGAIPLEPPDGGTGLNNVSIVLLGAIGDRRFLLAGDVEEELDRRLLTAGLPRLDLLKVAHHGSRTATTQAFVDATRPRIAVASAGIGNPYGHPTRQTIERLQAVGAQVYRTDEDGSVSVRFGATGLSVDLEGARAADRPMQARLPITERSNAARARINASANVAAFRCAIPITALVPEREPTPPPAPRRAAPTQAPSTVGYHRPDDGTQTRGGRLPPALPGSSGLVRATRARRGGGRGVPCGPDRGRRDQRGSTAGGVGRPAPRCRQGGVGGRSEPSPAARRRLGRLAHPARAP